MLKKLRPTNWLIILVIVAFVATGLGILLSFFIISPNQAKMQTQSPEPTLITEKVKYQKIANTVISRGEIKSNNSFLVGTEGLVTEGNSATPVGPDILTNVFMKKGETVQSGSLIAEISGRPFFLLQGDTTTYRNINPNDSGPDVASLQVALANLGYYYGAINGNYDASTWDAVTRFYQDRGYQPLTQTVVDSEIDNSEVSTNASNDNKKEEAPKPPVKAPIVPRSEIKILPTLGVITDIAQKIHYGVPDVIVAVTGSDLMVEATVPKTKSKNIKPGNKVKLYITDKKIIQGVVSNAEPQVAKSNDDDKQDLDDHFMIKPDEKLDYNLINSDIKVTFVTSATNNKVLAVPLGAISSNSSGEAFVIKIGKNEEFTNVKVTVGVHGDNLIEVEPNKANALKEGDTVLIGR